MKKYMMFLGEYFFGLESRKWFKNHESHIKEFLIDDKTNLEDFVNDVKSAGTAWHFIGKFIPNMVLAYGISIGNPLTIALGESVRIWNIMQRNKFTGRIDISRKKFEAEFVKQYKKEIDGEEWKYQ